MKRYLIGLVLSFCCFMQYAIAKESPLSSTYLGSRENDPESLVHNVSTIHGDYTEVEVDLTVPSPDSLILSRFYSSRDTIQTATFGGWRFNPQCFLSIQKDPKGKTYTTAEGKFERAYVYVGNPDGTILTYVGWQNTTNPSKRSLFKIDPEGESVGLCNTAKGNISSWTNLKNNELYFNPQTDSFELLLCSEGKRFYAKHPSLDIYFITQEILPSGNKLFYEFDEKGRLSLIKETNASENKVLAWIRIQYGDGIHVETSDGKTADYHFQQDFSGAHLLTAVERSNKPSVQYQYQVVGNHPLLVRKTLPEGRFVQVDYYTDKANQHKVRLVTIPAGSNGTTGIHFSYEDGCTEVDGPGSSKAVHRFNEDDQLVALEQYLEGALYRVHKKAWGTKSDAGNLVSTSIEDSSGNVFYYKSFKYDDRNKGNIVEEREYGNLTGANSTPLSIDEDGRSDQEAHVKTYSYFSGKTTHGFFQKDEKGTGLKCWYKKGTNLLVKKFVLTKGSPEQEEEDVDSGIKKRHFYDYNEDAALVRVIVDDGNYGEAKQTYNVRERHITLISPKQELPNVGAPELIEEKYLDVSGGKEVLLKRTVNQFDGQGFIVSEATSDANGTHRYTLTKGYTKGLLSFETDPMGNETHYFYDANQNLTQVSRSDTGVSVEYGYDLRNRLIYTLEKDRMGHQFETQVAYDPAGYKTLEIDRFGNETVYVNDSLGRPVQITYPEASDGPKSLIRPTYTYTYGLFDNLLSVTDPRGKLVTTSFNSRGKPTAIQHLDGSQELFKYDHEGSLHRYLGRDGLVQVFEYDYIGRLNHIEYYKRGSKGSEEGFKRKYFNYSTFHLTSEQDDRGNKTTYTYDGAGRLATLSKGDQKVEFSYDALGRTQGVKKWKSSNAFTLEVKEYDLLNRVMEQQTQDSQGHTLARNKYIYNEEGQLAQIIGYPQNQETTLTQYEYDGLGRICKIIGSSNQVTVIRYDDAYVNEWGQKTRKRTVTDPLGNQTEESFDNAGHLIKVSKKDKTGHLLAETESSYDLSGNKVLEKAARISSEGLLSTYETEWSFLDDEQSTAEYEYNALSQLILEKGEYEHRYSYDSLGNRLQRDGSAYKVDDLNQLVEAEGATYTFDANGNLATKTIGQKTWIYQWSPLNQLVSIKDPDQNVVSFTYDLSGKRLTKKIEPKGKKAKIFRFFYLGHTEIGSLDEKGAIVELKVPSNPNNPEISPCVAIEVRKETYVPLYDLQGNITCLLDHQRRKVVESYRYSSFGEEEITNERGRVVSDSTIGNPWRYCGKRVDKEVGLVCFGQRYYDSEIGRWISPDPAGNIDGPNLYTFARNNPMTYIDYFGLASEMNENQSKEFSGYFYGEYEPHCHCEAHRDCKRGGDIGATVASGGIRLAGVSHQVADFILNNPRFHGTLQALGGLAEASFGGGMTLATYGAAAPFGWPVMAHGLDQFITGVSTAFTGRPRDTLTSQLLQKTGMSHQTASFIDSGLSIGGTMGAAAVIHSSRLAVFPNFRLPIASEVIFREEMLQETQEITKFWPSAAQGRRFINDLEYSTHALERMSPRGLIQRGTEIISRGIPPSVVENAIKFGTKITGNTANEIVHVFDNVKVVTNADSSRVITVITAGK